LSVRVGLALLKAELSKAWARPILEVTIALMAILSVASIRPLTEIYSQSDFSTAFQSIVAESVSATMTSLMLPLVLMCAVLMSLSFARDYESGLMQSLLSVPVSRSLFFTVKFVAVILPLALLSWFFSVFFVGITFYSSPWIVLQFSFYVLPVSVLALMFCGGIGVLVALLIKRTIPSVLTTLIANFFFWFICSMESEYVYRSFGANFANYVCLAPFKSSLVFLDKLLGIQHSVSSSLIDPLVSSFSVGSFGILVVFWACVLVVPMVVYFSRRFEICD
jgi:ABC-type transport system involved in multi-copper enzyme maturation permease subunit